MGAAGKNRLVVAVFAAGVLGAVWCYLWSKNVTRVALDIPLQLSVSHIQTPEFFTTMNSAYWVAIHFYGERDPFDRLDCRIGMSMHGAPECSNVPEVLNVSWRLTAGRNQLGSGSSRETRAASYAYHDVDRYIGMFDGHRNTRYKLDLDIVQDGTQLLPTNPHLTVEPNLNGFEGWLMLTGLLFYVSLFCAAVGIVILALARRRRQADEVWAKPSSG